MFKKFTSSLIVAAVAVSLTATAPAHAGLFGGGLFGGLGGFGTMPVIDHTAIAKLAMELDRWDQELAQIDPSNTYALQQKFQEYRQLQGELNGLLADYQQLQNQWDETYQDYSEWSGKTGADYANDVQQVSNSTKEAQRQAMLAQGLAADTNNDMEILDELLSSNQHANGAVKAQQVANQMAALQIQQLVRLQEMISQNNQAQLMYLREKQQNEERFKAATQPMYDDNPDLDQSKQGGVNPYGEN